MTDRNVYAPPREIADADLVENIKLYKLSGITIATFFGSPIAGGFLISRNYLALGKDAVAKKALIYSVLGTVAFIILMSVIDSFVPLPNTSFSVPLLIAVYFLAKQYQGEFIDNHKDQNGAFFSNWRAFGISLLVILVLLAVLFPIIYVWMSMFGA